MQHEDHSKDPHALEHVAAANPAKSDYSVAYVNYRSGPE